MLKNESSVRDLNGAIQPSAPESPAPSAGNLLGRRSFMKRLGVAGAALPPRALLTSEKRARAEDSCRNTRGEAAHLQFLAAGAILVNELWEQYNELALRNASF